MTKEEETFSEACVEVMSRIAASVAVLTLEDSDGVRRGMTITSLTSVAAEPPTVLVCVANTASSRPSMVPGQTFCANLLGADQVSYSIGFSWGKSDDPFGDFDWKPAKDGTPVLTGPAAHLICEVEQVVEYHGSAVVMARVIDCCVHNDEALVYWRRIYHGALVPVEEGVAGKW